MAGPPCERPVDRRGPDLVRDPRDLPNGDQDPGVSDKRVLIVESELSRTLTACDRKGNTLAPVMCSAYDGTAVLRIATKDPTVATNAHISVTGHSTLDDVREHLPDTERRNGWANRLLWCAARRSRLLPTPSLPAESEWVKLVSRTRVDIRHAYGGTPSRQRCGAAVG